MDIGEEIGIVKRPYRGEGVRSAIVIREQQKMRGNWERMKEGEREERSTAEKSRVYIVRSGGGDAMPEAGGTLTKPFTGPQFTSQIFAPLLRILPTRLTT
jgi:hypothetical protein